MAGDPRGHDDGDIFVSSKDRAEALYVQLEAFLLDLHTTEGATADELISLCRRAALAMRGKAT